MVHKIRRLEAFVMSKILSQTVFCFPLYLHLAAKMCETGVAVAKSRAIRARAGREQICARGENFWPRPAHSVHPGVARAKHVKRIYCNIREARTPSKIYKSTKLYQSKTTTVGRRLTSASFYQTCPQINDQTERQTRFGSSPSDASGALRQVADHA